MSGINFQSIFYLGREKFDYSDPVNAPHLIYRGSGGGFTDYALTNQETTIGRSKKNHIIVKEYTVSKMHASILRERECAFVKDKSTEEQKTNGVSVNGEKLHIGEKRLLKNRDILKFGPNINMTFYDTADKVPILEDKKSIKFDSMHLLPLMRPISVASLPLASAEFVFENGDDTDYQDLKNDYEKLLCIYELLIIPNNSSLNQHFEKVLQLLLNLDKNIQFGAVFLQEKDSVKLKMKHLIAKSHEIEIEAENFTDVSFFETALKSDFLQDHIWNVDGTIYAAPFFGEISGLLCLYSTTLFELSAKNQKLYRAITNQLSSTIDNRMLSMEQIKSAYLREQISRFLPPEIVRTMSNEQEILQQGARKVNATMLFVDIRGFTTYSEKCTPEALVSMLNEYFERLVQCVFKHNGLVDKFVGDCLMAIFGTIETDPKPELRAMEAALDIQEAVDIGLNADLKRKGLAPITVGIGLHTGKVLAGFFGSQMRREYSVQGDNVQIASKACDEAKNNRVCATGDTLLAAYPGLTFRTVGSKMMKGRKDPVYFYDAVRVTSGGSDLVSMTDIISKTFKSAMNLETITEVLLNKPENYPYLVSQKKYGFNELHCLTNEKTTIGKAATCAIRLTLNKGLPEASLKPFSKQHAEIIRVIEDDSIKGVYISRAHGSKETTINGESLHANSKILLKNGDKIAFANLISMEYYQNRKSIPTKYLENAFEDFDGNVHVNFGTMSADKMINSDLPEVKSIFKPAHNFNNREELREDCEKLSLVYNLATFSSKSLESHLKRALDCIFEILPCIDNGAIVLIDSKTGPSAKLVKFRNADDIGGDIILNHSIFSRVYETKTKIISTGMDTLGNDASNILIKGPSSVICIPLISHQKVHGIAYLSLQMTTELLSEKEASLLDAICNQMAVSIENSKVRNETMQVSKLRKQIGRYLSPALALKISNPEEILSKRVSRKTATILYVNIIDFSSFREKNTDSEIENCLNAYFEIGVKSVFNFNGTVDKYIGNYLMAVFGTLEEIPGPELRAVRAALEIKQNIEKMNQERSGFKKDPISIKIGINTGTVVYGLIGSTLRLEYTVIGDAVNIAARTTSAASENQILITESTYGYIRKNIDTVKIGEKQFKGKSQPITCYEALSLSQKTIDDEALPLLPVKESTKILLERNGFL